MRLPFFNGDVAHRFLPVGLGESDRRRLDRALDQQTVTIATLRRAGDLAPMPEQVELLGADEALAGQFLVAAKGQLCLDTHPGECIANPFMDRSITFCRA